MIAQWRCSPTKQQQEKSFWNKIVLKEEANYFYDYELCEKKHIPVYTMYSLCSLFALIFFIFLNWKHWSTFSPTDTFICLCTSNLLSAIIITELWTNRFLSTSISIFFIFRKSTYISLSVLYSSKYQFNFWQRLRLRSGLKCAAPTHINAL